MARAIELQLVESLTHGKSATLHFPRELQQLAIRYQRQIGRVLTRFPKTMELLGLDEAEILSGFMASAEFKRAGEIPAVLHEQCYEEAFYRYILTLRESESLREIAAIECVHALAAILVHNGNPCFKIGRDLFTKAGENWRAERPAPGEPGKTWVWMVDAKRVVLMKMRSAT